MATLCTIDTTKMTETTTTDVTTEIIINVETAIDTVVAAVETVKIIEATIGVMIGVMTDAMIDMWTVVTAVAIAPHEVAIALLLANMARIAVTSSKANAIASTKKILIKTVGDLLINNFYNFALNYSV